MQFGTSKHDGPAYDSDYPMTRDVTTADVDGATVEIVRNYLNSAATEMQRTLTRTAYNTIIYEILDFGISLYDSDRNLIADSPGLSLFLGANDYSLEKGVQYVGEENLEPGDVLILNYPYWNSSHTLDVTLFAPIFLDEGNDTGGKQEDDGRLVGYAVSRAHWLDLGAKDPGYVLDSTDVHQEGVLFPGTKVYDGGEPNEEILDIIRFNSRLPEKVIGDLNAQIAALRTGTDRVEELHEKYGTETVESAIDQILDHGAETAREAVAYLPDGSWTAHDYLDNDGITTDPIEMAVEVTVDGEEFHVDFSGSSEQVAGPVNVPLGRTQAASKFCLKTLTTPDQAANTGHYDPLDITVPEGNLFNASHPAPTYTLWASILVVDVIYKALASGMPDRIPASSGGDVCSVMLYGEDTDTGEKFVEANNEGVGWGGTAGHDGSNALMHVVQTMVRNVPVEVFETKAPIAFDRLSLRQDSGGAGKHRGGLGIRRDYRITDEVEALTLIKKTRTDGWALDGGSPGARNVVVLDELEEDWAERVQVFADNSDLYEEGEHQKHVGMMRGTFQPGEIVSNRTGGGGGYGNPLDRDPERVLEDVIDGYVSRTAAREEYGVVITEDGGIDEDRTERIRRL